MADPLTHLDELLERLPHLRPCAGELRGAYALLLGYLCDVRGEALFHTLWARLLDAPIHILREQAIRASQQGWLEYRHAGEVTEISFHYLLSEERYE